MKEEFCHFCGEEIGQFFWTWVIEEISPLLESKARIVKVCDNPDCLGEGHFYLALHNDSLRLKALGRNTKNLMES